MSLPNLIVPGAAKSGTSSLHKSLRQHPDVFMSPKKEPHFFSYEPSASRERCYRELFERGGGVRVRGESSTSYMVIPAVPGRIARALERPKFIFILRNPVDRVASHYRWLQSLDLESRSLRCAFLADRDATSSIHASIRNTGNYCYYYQFSGYGTSLERYLSFFDRSQIKIVTFERFARDHDAVMRECFSFLGLADDFAVTRVRSNVTLRVRPARRVALRLDRSIRSRFPWLGRLRGVYRWPGRGILGVVERVSPPDQAMDLSQQDRRWLAVELAEEVGKLRSLWDDPFSDWCIDFPLSDADA